MSKKTIHVAEMLPVSRAYAQDLARRFRPVDIKPGMTLDEIMYNAGEQRVVQFVLQTSVNREVSGDPAKLRDETKPSIWMKLFGLIPRVR